MYKILFFSLILVTLQFKGQTSSELSVALKNLTEVKIKGPVMIDKIIIFSSDGKRINIDELSKLQNDEYKSIYYANEKGEVKVMILKKLSSEEIFSRHQNIKNEILQELDKPRKPAKSLKVRDIKNNIYTLESLNKKIIVINFWFIGCAPCEKEIPELNKLVNKYSGKDVVFLGITFNDKIAIEKFLAKKEFKYNIIPQANNLINEYKVSTYPTQLIIDKNSKIALVSGTQSSEILDEVINKLLKENK